MSNKIRIRKRGNTYSYSFDISKNPRRMKEKGGFATEDEAFDAGVAAYADWKNGNIGITSEKVKLRDYLAAWLQTVVRPNVKLSTYQNYKNSIVLRTIPYLGDIYVQDLRPRNVDEWMTKLAKKGLSHGTIGQSKTILSIALKYAVYPAELITANPTTGLSIPRCAPRKVIRRTIITPEQFASIPEETVYYPLIKILYHTGMRISEALGITWDDVDLATGAISVVRQRQKGGYFETPKTDTSARTFYADDTLLSYLRTLRASQKKEELRLGKAYQVVYEDVKHDRALVVLPKLLPHPEYYERRTLICIRLCGIPFRHGPVTSALRRLQLNAHSFRHTHATKLIEAGAKCRFVNHMLHKREKEKGPHEEISTREGA